MIASFAAINWDNFNLFPVQQRPPLEQRSQQPESHHLHPQLIICQPNHQLRICHQLRTTLYQLMLWSPHQSLKFWRRILTFSHQSNSRVQPICHHPERPEFAQPPLSFLRSREVFPHSQFLDILLGESWRVDLKLSFVNLILFFRYTYPTFIPTRTPSRSRPTYTVSTTEGYPFREEDNDIKSQLLF